MNQLSKRGDFSRKYRSFKKHCWLLFQPFLFAVLVCAIWYWFLFQKGIHFSKKNESVLLEELLVILVVPYGITMASTFGSVWEKYQKVSQSVLKKDMETFLCYRDERIPIIIHLLILAFSTPILGIVVLTEYRTSFIGLFTVFWTSFVMALYGIVIAELQNPSQSLWFAERIPKEWLTEDIDKHFHLVEEERNEGEKEGNHTPTT